MTLYERKSFTVPASAGNAVYCAEHGHTMPDVRGKCVRCSAQITPRQFIAQLTSAQAPMRADETS